VLNSRGIPEAIAIFYSLPLLVSIKFFLALLLLRCSIAATITIAAFEGNRAAVAHFLDSRLPRQQLLDSYLWRSNVEADLHSLVNPRRRSASSTTPSIHARAIDPRHRSTPFVLARLGSSKLLLQFAFWWLVLLLVGALL
jgi:hypothetical protein